MPTGLNRHNDTPIGGLPEFRGNMQGGEVFGVDDVPAWDGEKFSPASNSALLHAYGGLVTDGSVEYVADGSLIDNWGGVMPLAGIPLQCTPDDVTGIIEVDLAGIYTVNFTCNLTGLDNNQSYAFTLFSAGGNTGFGTHVVGSNNVSSQSTSFSLQLAALADGIIAIGVSSDTDNVYTVISASFTVQRIG